MWRKTLTPGSICDGVDPNRNWDDHWNGIVHNSPPLLVNLLKKKRSSCTVKCETLHNSDTLTRLKRFVFFTPCYQHLYNKNSTTNNYIKLYLYGIFYFQI
jgi:hypothetical protein